MIAFRLATVDDSAAIAELERKYIECAWSESVVRSTVEDELSVIFLLTDGDEIIGYGGLKTVLDTAEVYNIVVCDGRRRHGYGSMILEKLLTHAKSRGAVEITLEVASDNLPAIGLYAKYGFESLYVRKGYYASGDAIVMVKRL